MLEKEKTNGFSYRKKDGFTRLSIDYLPTREYSAVRGYVEKELNIKPASVMYFNNRRLEEIFEKCRL
ncbi:MAG: hypothetical protein ABEK17_02995 [Candidatus Aenigmatarchaeota archaeon]